MNKKIVSQPIKGTAPRVSGNVAADLRTGLAREASTKDQAENVMVVDLVRNDFFFQAEDGIRRLTVTGVQTCALPISRRDRRWPARGVGQGIFVRTTNPGRG